MLRTPKPKISFGEKRKIYKRYETLLKLSESFLKEEDTRLIREAIEEAFYYYSDEKLPNGESVILHLLEVAVIVVERIGLATKSVLACLLYDLVKREKISLKDVEKKYGKKVTEIITGLLKIFDLNASESNYQPENFRKLLITLSDDVRVILIRLAILLDEMRRMNYMPREYQVKTAMKTFSLYAPLAHRLGLYSIKSELEDLSMKFTENEAYRSIIKKLKNTTAKRNRFIKKFIDPIRKELDRQGFDFEVKGRTKSVYSIWKKMQKQNVPFEQIYDIFAIRIILNSKENYEKSDCWRVYSIVSDYYQPNPNRLRDWISIPKSNGYESLHTTVIGPEGKWVEVQIRTKRMDEIAERGYAAHWKYKGIKGDKAFNHWMESVREILEANDSTAAEVVDNMRLNLDSKEIFVFTPSGELRQLPENSTLLDFAFDIHSEVGSKCVGGIVNNKNVSFKYKLNNGDQVEILTSKNQTPKQDWLNAVITSKAKSKIRQSLKEEQKKEADHGKELLKRRLKNWKIKNDQNTINKLISYFNYKEATDFFYDLGLERIDINDIKEILTQKEEKNQLSDKEPEKQEVQPGKQKEEIQKKDDYIEIGDNLKDIDYKLAKCCNPIFGDDIIGFVTTGNGIKIHRSNCPNARRMISKYDYRVIKVNWAKTKEKQSFQTQIKISGIDELGMINKLSDIISNNMKVKMQSISLNSDNGMFEGHVNVYVTSIKHLQALLKKLRKLKGVLKVTRTDLEI